MIKHGEERAREVLLAAGAEKILAKNDDKVVASWLASDGNL
jgi:hypothetical protein